MTDTTPVDVATAARVLGITPDAVRARIRRGTLPATTDADGRYLVRVPAGAGVASPTAGDMTAELLATLRREIEDLRRDRDQYARLADFLAAQNAALTQRILPPPPATTPEATAPEATADTTPDTTAPERETPPRRGILDRLRGR